MKRLTYWLLGIALALAIAICVVVWWPRQNVEPSSLGAAFEQHLQEEGYQVQKRTINGVEVTFVYPAPAE